MSDGERPPRFERVRAALLRPSGAAGGPAASSAVVADGAGSAAANDKERMIGLIAAPLAAAIGFLITNALIAHDPAALLPNGQPNKLHVSVSLYHEVLLALLALSVLMMVTAMLRKRLFLGIVLALYGLTVFNLHYWGFGIPYLMFGAWMIVTAYRVQRAHREATGSPTAATATTRTSSPSRRPKASGRYTPKSP